MKLIIGIGNPDKQYQNTRHNVGFEILDKLNFKLHADSFTHPSWTREKRLNAEYSFRQNGVVLVRPLGYVNNTGVVVSAVLKWNQLQDRVMFRDMLVVCDDVNLEFGKLRLRDSGSAGGHHGLESIIHELGLDEFPRLRVGVKNESMPEDLTSYVLEEFNSKEKKELPKILEKAVLTCESWADEGFGAAMNRLSQLQSIKERE